MVSGTSDNKGRQVSETPGPPKSDQSGADNDNGAGGPGDRDNSESGSMTFQDNSEGSDNNDNSEGSEDTNISATYNNNVVGLISINDNEVDNNIPEFNIIVRLEWVATLTSSAMPAAT